MCPALSGGDPALPHWGVFTLQLCVPAPDLRDETRAGFGLERARLWLQLLTCRLSRPDGPRRVTVWALGGPSAGGGQRVLPSPCRLSPFSGPRLGGTRRWPSGTVLRSPNLS